MRLSDAADLLDEEVPHLCWLEEVHRLEVPGEDDIEMRMLHGAESEFPAQVGPALAVRLDRPLHEQSRPASTGVLSFASLPSHLR